MKAPAKNLRRRWSHETWLFVCAFLAGFPGSICALVLLWSGDYRVEVAVTWSLVIVSCWIGFSYVVRERAVHALRILSNILTGMREGDYSMRARRGTRTGALSELALEINALSTTLHRQRLSEMEITALLTTVMREIDVAVFAFDTDRKLRLANQAAQALLNRPNEELMGMHARDLGLSEFIEGDPERLVDRAFPGGSGRWGMNRSRFHERGRPHDLVVLTDLTRTLREEELLAWQRLVRVLGHELNNSLASIKSISGSLGTLVKKESRPQDWEEDLKQGLEIIESRSENLNRFLQAYTRLARLPKPTRGNVDLRTLLERVAALEKRVNVAVISGEPSPTLRVDSAQLEQALINLVRNAAEAILSVDSVKGKVTLTWEMSPPEVVIQVLDNGPGVGSSTNLFVPFFTTKPEGSGIGLVLVRQIAENHGGSLRLEDRADAPGSCATLRLPL